MSMKSLLLRCLALAAIAPICLSCMNTLKVSYIDNITEKIDVKGAKYLLLPVQDKARETLVTPLSKDGTSMPFSVRLAEDSVDYYVPYRLPAEGASLRVDNCSFENLCWTALKTSNQFKAAPNPFEPSIHFAPSYGWNNDPNGLIWLDGNWHLFFQYNPYGSKWGNMTWGHAVSKDLVHWTQLDNAIFPDSLGTIFSGSCVIDKDNSAGFGKDAMVAVYTCAGKRQVQCLAYSADEGKTFAKYVGNPVLTSEKPDFRDPKVFWHKETGKWIMSLAAGNVIEFYSSSDLKHWKYESCFGEGYGYHNGVWECPDLFELPVDGNPGDKRWVLLTSSNIGGSQGPAVQYFTGKFDGHSFVCENKPESSRLVDYGRDFYAAVTWDGVPDGRRIMIGWMSNFFYADRVPDIIQRGGMTVPRELRLKNVGGEIALCSIPVSELGEVARPVSQTSSFDVDGEHHCESYRGGCAIDVKFEISDLKCDIAGIKLFDTKGDYADILIDVSDSTLKVEREHCQDVGFSGNFAFVNKAKLSGANPISVEIVIDRASIECFANGGEVAVTEAMFPAERLDRMSFYAVGGRYSVSNLVVREIK